MARPTPRVLLLAAAACAAAFVALLALAYGGGRAQGIDNTALQGFLGLDVDLAESVSALGGPVPIGLMAVALAVYALARGRPRSAAFVIVLLALTSVSSQVLKTLLAYDRPDPAGALAFVNEEAFPSGHATSSMSLAIALLVVVPARLRPLAAITGAGFSLAVSFAIVAAGWHFPSDVVGGYLVAAFWALVLLAGLGAADRSDAPPALDRVAAPGLGVAAVGGGIVLAGVGAVAVALRGGTLLTYLQTHTATLAVGGALVFAALGLLGALTLASARTR